MRGHIIPFRLTPNTCVLLSKQTHVTMQLIFNGKNNLETITARLLIKQGERDPQTIMRRSLASRATVFRLLREAKNPNAKKVKKKPGPPPVLSPANRDSLRRIAIQTPNLSNEQLAARLEMKGGPSVSSSTIRRVLPSIGIERKRGRKVPILTATHKAARLAWCLRHRGRDWKNVVFSDESKFQFFPNSVKLLTVKGKTPVLPQAKHSPSMMVWGAFSWRGTTPLAIVKGIIDSAKYQDIIKAYLLPTMDVLYPKEEGLGIVFQQDNAAVHVSRSSRAFFADIGIEVMDWPACSPDLNPIENLWAILKKRIARMKRTSLDDWRKRIHEEWEKLSHELLQNLVNSMENRIAACIAAKGGYTKY